MMALAPSLVTSEYKGARFPPVDRAPSDTLLGPLASVFLLFQQLQAFFQNVTHHFDIKS